MTGDIAHQIARVLRLRANEEIVLIPTDANPPTNVAITSPTSGVVLTPGRTLTITVTNAGNAASSGQAGITNALPASFTATAMSGSGWTINLGALTATRSDSLPAGSAYPPLVLTVNVASNAPGVVTNTAMVFGGGDSVSGNNNASDIIAINSAGGGGGGVATTLIGWDVSGQTNFGISPLSPTTNAANLVLGGLTRGAGVNTNATAAARAWGGVGWTNSNAANAAASNQFLSFTIAASSGYHVSFSSLSKFDYRRSSTGPATGVLQYRIGSGAFVDISNLSYTVTTSSGGSLGPIDLSGVAALQNVGAPTNVTFRIVNYGGGSSGTWYVFDVASTSAPDLGLVGTVSSNLQVPAQPVLLNPVVTNQVFTFTLSGTPGFNYGIESSTNLINWTLAGTVSNSTGQVGFSETNAVGTLLKVYRAHLLP